MASDVPLFEQLFVQHFLYPVFNSRTKVCGVRPCSGFHKHTLSIILTEIRSSFSDALCCSAEKYNSIVNWRWLLFIMKSVGFSCQLKIDIDIFLEHELNFGRYFSNHCCCVHYSILNQFEIDSAWNGDNWIRVTNMWLLFDLFLNMLSFSFISLQNCSSNSRSSWTYKHSA